MQNDTQNIIGVDVGSGSVRAGVFNLRGELLAHATREITLFRSAGNKVEQSSREIWQAVCYCIKTAVANAGVSPSSIAGIGFDATCSLVVIGDNDAPLAVGPSDDADRNIIVWMDHRATGQAEKINATGHPVLRYVGGKISPEMQTPKILWLKENRPHIYQQARHFFDLADYLTWRSTGDEARSVADDHRLLPQRCREGHRLVDNLLRGDDGVDAVLLRASGDRRVAELGVHRVVAQQQRDLACHALRLVAGGCVGVRRVAALEVVAWHAERLTVRGADLEAVAGDARDSAAGAVGEAERSIVVGGDELV